MVGCVAAGDRPVEDEAASSRGFLAGLSTCAAGGARLGAGCGIVGVVGVGTVCAGLPEAVCGGCRSQAPTGVVLEVKRMRFVYGCPVSPSGCVVAAGVYFSAHGVMRRPVAVYVRS